MHKRSKSSQMQGMEEGGMIRSLSTEWGGDSRDSSGGSSSSSSSGGGANPNAPSSSDSFNMALLIMLYAMQGVPLGLSLGSIPFILKSQATYTQVGVFSLAGYPYSMKLLWSPIVDTVFSSRLGWRKSWVLPMQMTSGLLMLFSARTADYWLETANIHSITMLFFVFVLLAATQDIAVDGWALTLLSRKNIGYASTCQTIGINSGYFMSFTIFLALNDASFCNSYLRSTPSPKGVLTLSKYFYFWGWFYIITTVLLLFKSEKAHHHNTQIAKPPLGPPSNEARPDSNRLAEVADDNKRHHGKEKSESSRGGLRSLVDAKADVSGRKERFGLGNGSLDDRVAGSIQQMGVKRMYVRLWAVVTLPSIRFLSSILLISKLGSITAEAVGVFKLMEKGVTREVVSLVVLIEFPLELIFAVFAGRWASKGRPFTPWLTGYYLRLGMAATSTLLVALFPVGATMGSAPFFYFMIILSGVLTSFSSTMMFVAQGTFFSRISDSSMGGTYLTLLNTIANFGSAWPKFFVFILLDMFTVQKCVNAKAEDGGVSLSCAANKAVVGKNLCTDAGGSCVTTLDGFYPLSFGMVLIGLVIGRLCSRKLRDLEMAKEGAWRA